MLIPFSNIISIGKIGKFKTVCSQSLRVSIRIGLIFIFISAFIIIQPLAHAQNIKSMTMPGHKSVSSDESSQQNANNTNEKKQSISPNTIEVQSGATEISLSATPQSLAKTQEVITAQQRAYEGELANCEKLSDEDKTYCLKEVKAVEQMKREGVDLNNYQSAAQLERNALARCDKLTGQDKFACQARMMGYGTNTGSVESGGIIREINTKYQAGRSAITVLPLDAK